ncbi:MAG TPA: GNAT family N-acetyltransferase, partial [Anaerolineaceae bacterium]|nr:GNAT family N-acetyltransferase [Anaerolineaceae bacterium]
MFQNIIVLEWYQNQVKNNKFNGDLNISTVETNDFPAIIHIDKKCFSSFWQLPSLSMKEAYYQAGYFTKAVLNGKIIGYQLCTESPSSAHLARLAVDPEFQGNNFGKALVNDVLKHYLSSGINQITVNTQDDNLSSQALYQKLGFQISEEKYPVLVRNL